MATVYYSPDCRAGNNVIARANPGLNVVCGTFNIATAGEGGGVAFVDEDVIQMVKVPAGATIVDCILDVCDLDSSTGIRVSVGYGATTYLETLIAINDGAIAGEIIRMDVAGGSQLAFTTEDTIDVHITTVASGTAATTGIIKLTVFYVMP